MDKLKSIVIFLCILILGLSGCQYKLTHEEYQSKSIGSKIDKKVKISYGVNKDRARLQLEFEEKEIPFEFTITPGENTYLGKYELSGTLAEGSISIELLSVDKKEKYEQFTYEAGKLRAKQQFDLYGGEYILRIGFNDAKKGRLKLTFQTSQI